MPDNKLKDNEIIKALECCSTYKGKCADCPAFVKVDRSNCKQVLLGAIEIINRLQEEKEALINGQETLQKYIADLQAENERLQEAIDEQDIEISRLYKRIDEAKAEAYKEFAERLKAKAMAKYKTIDNEYLYEFDNNFIDNLLNELVGE